MTVDQRPPASPIATSNGVAFAAIVLTSFTLRTAVTGFSVLVGAAANALVFGPLLAGAIGTIVTACFALAAFAAPSLARRFGLERTAALALTATTVGIALRALAWSPEVLVLGTVIAFAGVGTSNVILVPIVRERFASRLKTVSTVYMVMLQLGQLVAPIIAVAMAGSVGWRFAAGIWALFTGVATVLWTIENRAHDPATRDPAPAMTPPPAVSRPRRSLVLGLIGVMAMTALHTYTLVTWLPTIFRSAGIDEANGALLLAWFAGLGLVAAFVVPPLTARLRNPYAIVVLCVGLLATGYVGLLLDPAAGALAWATALGLGVSTFPLCLTLIAARSVDSREASRLSGLVQGIGYGIGCVGPLGLGVLNEVTGGWTLAIDLLIASLAVTLVAGWYASRPTEERPA